MFIQILGIIAFLLFSYSFTRKLTKNIIFYQVISNLFFTVHYLLLGSFSASIVHLILIAYIFMLDYYKDNKNKVFKYLILFLIIYILIGIITYDNFYSVLPIVGSLIYSISILKNNKMLSIISSLIWLFFNIIVISIGGIFLNLICIIIYILKFKECYER